MTKLLETAFAEASKLSPLEQDLLARRLLAELAAEDEFDRAIAQSAERLVGLAADALDDMVEDLDPEKL